MNNSKIVGRAELKLAEAMQAFHYDFRGKIVLDIGSSTGGFTELALRMGAGRVIAVEKGTQQMKAPLRFDQKVDLYEKTDFFNILGMDDAENIVVKRAGTDGREKVSAVDDADNADGADGAAGAGSLSSSGNSVRLVKPLRVQTVVADVSFVSLKNILRHARKIVTPNADYLVMLKPQFEAKPWQLINGVVKNERMRRDIIKDFEQWLARNRFLVIKKHDNELTGRNGNRERFYYLKSSDIAVQKHKS